VSILPTFYEQLFHTKEFVTALLNLEFVSVNFCLKEIGKKTAREMMVKLTPALIL